MFRFTIRELLILTASAGLAIGWWLEHRAHVEAAEDARMLAHFSVSSRMCSNEASWFMELQRKYGAERIDWKELLSQPEDEAKLGIELAP
jgi:hypothetical protein